MTSAGAAHTINGKRNATEELVRECLKNAKTEAKLELGEAFRKEIFGLREELSNLQKELNTSHTRIDELEATLKNNEKEIAQLKTKIEKSKWF